MSHQPIQHVVNHSWHNTRWNWLAKALPELAWTPFTRQSIERPRNESLRSLMTAWRAVKAASQPGTLLVSHGALPATYAELMSLLTGRKVRHVVYAFNFTTLPRGLKRWVMQTMLSRVERLAVFSTMERTLYARHFHLPPEKIDYVPWSANPLEGGQWPEGLTPQDFVCAIGSQARDYRTLLAAAAELPHIPIVIVAAPENLADLTVPSNVQVFTRLPLAQVGGILLRSRFMVLPLLTSEVPCGHVTLVSAFHAGKAVVVTDSTGIHDYICPGENGLLTAPRSAPALSQAILDLWNDPARADAMGRHGQARAAQSHTEAATVSYFKGLLARLNTP